MRRLFAFLLCLCLLGRAAGALAREKARFTPVGKTPHGEFDLTVEFEVTRPRSLRGRIYFEYRPQGPSAGIELQRSAPPALFFEGFENTDQPRARGEGLGPGRHRLVARRREGPEGLASLCLELDGRVLDVRYVPLRADPEAAYGVQALSGLRITGLSMRSVQQAFFDDEFNWESVETSPWRRLEGDWVLTTTRDAWIAVDNGPFATSSYSARPAGEKPALSLGGPARVARAYVSVAAKIPEGAEAGIAFCVAERGRMPAMRALLVKPGPDGKGSARLVLLEELKKGASGDGSAEKTLAGPADAYVRPGAWTLLEVWSDWDYVRAALSSAEGGRVVLEADVADCPAGRVGLVAVGSETVLFDDFRVRPWHVVHERRVGERVRWTAAGGRELRRPGEVPCGLLTPAVPWPLGGFRLELRVERGEAFPVPCRPDHAPPAEAPLARRLVMDPTGPASVWSSTPLDRPGATLALDLSGPHAVSFVDGRPRFERVLEGASGGPPGIFSPSGSTCGRLVLEPSRRPHEVDVFSSDFSVPVVRLPHGRGVVRVVGDVLKPSSGSWRCARSGREKGKEGALQGRAGGVGLIRFSRPSPGDVRVETDLLPPGERSFAQAGLFIAAGKDKAGKLQRYSFCIEPGQGTELVLRRIGEKVAGRSIPLEAKPAALGKSLSLALERRGPDLLGYLGGELVLRWRDPDPLDGDAVGFFVRKGKAVFTRARITALRASRSDFRKVDPDWQPLSGEWLLHTGLACIPWDHWITAFGSAEGPAYMGLLWKPGPDVCVVLRVSEASEGFENRTHVHYPLHDVSITLRGELADPGGSGYRFLIAPLPRKDHVILFRNGREVARRPGFRVVMGGHNNQPREFTVVARARGGAVSCRIDGREVMSWTDPHPLGAGHVVLGAGKGRANFADVTVMDVSAPGGR